MCIASNLRCRVEQHSRACWRSRPAARAHEHVQLVCSPQREDAGRREQHTAAFDGTSQAIICNSNTITAIPTTGDIRAAYLKVHARKSGLQPGLSRGRFVQSPTQAPLHSCPRSALCASNTNSAQPQPRRPCYRIPPLAFSHGLQAGDSQGTAARYDAPINIPCLA